VEEEKGEPLFANTIVNESKIVSNPIQPSPFFRSLAHPLPRIRCLLLGFKLETLPELHSFFLFRLKKRRRAERGSLKFRISISFFFISRILSISSDKNFLNGSFSITSLAAPYAQNI
jgi:hypothetical protein